MQSELEQLKKDVQRFEERQEKEDKVRMGGVIRFAGRSVVCLFGWPIVRSAVRSVVWSCGLSVDRSFFLAPVQSVIRPVVDRSHGRSVSWSVRRFSWLLGRSVM